MAVSQGEPERLEGKTFFRHDHALQGISLSIAEFDNRSIEVDGTQYDIFFYKSSDFLLQAFEAPEKAFKFMIRDIKYMTESTVCQMDEDYKQKANAVWRKRGEIEGETRRHTARRDGIRINGLSLWRLRFLIRDVTGDGLRMKNTCKQESCLCRNGWPVLFISRAHHHLLRSGILWL